MKKTVFLAFFGVQRLAKISQKHVIYGKKREKGNIQDFKSTVFTAKNAILKKRFKQNTCILR